MLWLVEGKRLKTKSQPVSWGLIKSKQMATTCLSLDKDLEHSVLNSLSLDLDRTEGCFYLETLSHTHTQQTHVFLLERRVIQKCDWVRKEAVHLRKKGWDQIVGNHVGEKRLSSPSLFLHKNSVPVCVFANLVPYHNKRNRRHLVLMTDRVYIKPQSRSHQAMCGCVFRQVSIHFALNNFCVMAVNGNWKAKMRIIILKY